MTLATVPGGEDDKLHDCMFPSYSCVGREDEAGRSLVNGRDIVWATGLDDLGSIAFAGLCRFLLILRAVVLTHVYDDAGCVGGSSVKLVLLTCKYM